MQRNYTDGNAVMSVASPGSSPFENDAGQRNPETDSLNAMMATNDRHYDYDLLVLGAGSGGLAAAKMAANMGKKVALVEADLLGGTCVNRGCIPKKLIYYASQVPHLMKGIEGYGWSPAHEDSRFDWASLRERIASELSRLQTVHLEGVRKAGVELIEGHGRFVDPHTLQISPEGQHLTGRHVVIATGARPLVPATIPGLDMALTSDDMFGLEELPTDIAIMGAGYIGMEFACMLMNLGCRVTVVQRSACVLNGFDRDLTRRLEDSMLARGVSIRFNTLVSGLERGSHGKLIVRTNGEHSEPLIVDQLLCAIGRTPNVQDLNLEAAGIRTDGKAISVDESSRTNLEHVYAVGDCTNRVNLTPVAIAEARHLIGKLYGDRTSDFRHREIPSAVFADPEMATVGYSEQAALSLHGVERVGIYTREFHPLYEALAQRRQAHKTFMKIVVDRGDANRILGLHMLGEHAAEVVQGFAPALRLGARKQDLDGMVGIHPSVAEEFFTMK